ncbi:MAG TPA: Tex family protein [Phycisphaerae bacterium]|nr:Tex family protein [Phycisphaerae bacterium]HOJ73303.1 Tex family protein [Phycisphaerae bacterium]HON65265.1 Tex family protein [Phycisphaerae bacterium]HPU24561.1 Tex family protein [Phycisphaerae bacterium]
MEERHLRKIAGELNLNVQNVRTTAELLAGGATVPFIARYRKEATGSLDEVAIAAIRDRLEQLAELDKRREAIISSLAERNLLTDELKEKLDAAETLAVLEDIYLPFRPKRRTRATIAKEKGLEPLADILFAQDAQTQPEAEAAKFINEEKGVTSVEEALAGARDIIAERVSEDQQAREAMRKLFFEKGTIRSRVVKGKETEGAKFKDYFEWSESVANAPSHRVLAMRRGETEGFLILEVGPDEAAALNILDGMFVRGRGLAADQVKLAVHDGYKRLLAPSMETEVRMEMKKRADEAAIAVFAQNLRELLLAPPLGRKNVLALDPGYRTGCKLVVLDRQGKLLHHDVIYITHSQRETAQAGLLVKALCDKYEIEAIAIGNGTASRETEAFIRGLGLPSSIIVVMVNESGASVYSASEAAREEFPDHDVTVRGAVSIGRRLADPLAELVKIDPKSIGVGQYQHDVDQTALKKSLDDVVISCVNSVGVEVNTASRQLLTYVSGLGPQLAKNIVEYRNANGPFRSRKQLLEVPRLGAKAFEQAAGFLRIRDGENVLDASAVHPESYPIVEKMAADVGCSVADLLRDESLRRKIELRKYVSDKVGLPTLNDIMQELAKPGRDPREKFEAFSFAEGVEKIEDVKPGMKLPGIVTNVTAFGAFVDIGVHQDGLVHVSQLADRFVKDPNEVVKVHQRVMVTVLEVDLERKRIALSMRSNPEAAPRREAGVSTPRTTPRPMPGPAPRQAVRSPERRAEPANGGWFSAALNEAKHARRK